MSALSEFLSARLAEDAKYLDCGLRDHDRSRAGDATPDCWERPLSDCDFRDKREWITKGQIVKDAVDATRYATTSPERWGRAANVLDLTLKRLALVYADHPDYEERWRS